MKAAIVYKLACIAYKMLLRDLLQKAVADPDQEWDDVLMAALDKFFGYKEE